MSTHIIHPIEPFYDSESRILILGSFPSVKSRESGFYYGHPQNRFWPMLSRILGEPAVPRTIEEKSSLLRRHHIALWDTIHECDIEGSSDSSIRNVQVNDPRVILDTAGIRRIYANGTRSWELYERFCRPLTGREAVKMPSTSPANAAWSLERLITAWSEIRDWVSWT